jgi:hypothetical protein
MVVGVLAELAVGVFAELAVGVFAELVVGVLVELVGPAVFPKIVLYSTHLEIVAV